MEEASILFNQWVVNTYKVVKEISVGTVRMWHLYSILGRLGARLQNEHELQSDSVSNAAKGLPCLPKEFRAENAKERRRIEASIILVVQILKVDQVWGKRDSNKKNN